MITYAMRCLALAIVLASIASAVAGCVPPSWGAKALLHPARRSVTRAPSVPFEDENFMGSGVTLRGWRVRGSGTKRGTLIYLHGIADNRAAGAGVAERFARRGFDVIAYDSRAHGESGGAACTYGYYEKEDLKRVLDTVTVRPVVLLGASLGAAVALQTAAEDHRVEAVVAAEVFSDLSTLVRERVPFFVTRQTIEKALALAERQGEFRVSEVSPIAAAARIKVPVLIIHGARDRDTNPDHSSRVFEALRAPKRLILVPNAKHNQTLGGSDIWREIEEWIDGNLRAPAGYSKRN